jgi:hypothetical protein
MTLCVVVLERRAVIVMHYDDADEVPIITNMAASTD